MRFSIFGNFTRLKKKIENNLKKVRFIKVNEAFTKSKSNNCSNKNEICSNGSISFENCKINIFNFFISITNVIIDCAFVSQNLF